MTTNPKPSAEAQRRAVIKRRRETSTFWAAVHLFGTLKLAVVLIGTVAFAIGFATVMESKFDSKVAAYYIYNAMWFNFWLLALALNLICSALTRWPWQRKHVGFVVTHAGIILLLSGAVVGRIFGFEAFVTLDTTKPPESRLYLHEDILTINTAEGYETHVPFDTEMHPPTEKRPFTLGIEHPSITLVIDRVTENLVPDDTLAESTDPAAPLGVGLHFVNAGMGQNVAANLMQNDDANSFDFFGMAKIQLVDSLDEAHSIALVAKPEPSPAAPAARDDTPFHENQLVFAHHPEAPVTDTDSDVLSGYDVRLNATEGKPGDFTVTVTAVNGTTKTWPLSEMKEKWVNLQGDGDPIQVHVYKYWADFAVKDGGPVSLSDKPDNPAILVHITGPSKVLPPAPPKPTAAAPPLPQGLAMKIAPAKEPGQIVYQLERAGKIEVRATVAKGDTIHLGWSKWEAKVDQVFAHAELHRDVKEFEGTPTPMMAASFRPGVHAHLVSSDGKSGPVEWIPAGTERELFAAGDFTQATRIGFGQRVIPLTFQITLEKFEVPRDEGTETPSNYISTLRFDDLKSGRVVHDKAQMNSPAMFPGDFWRSVIGWNYKFSQANWNPQNLNETTLQVLYDPGWPLKWTGSLGISCGIALMFYFMPKRSASERGGRDEPEEGK